MLGLHLASALLIVYLDSAKNLPLCKNTPPDAYVTLQIKQLKRESDVIENSCKPVWEKCYTFMVINPKTAVLHVNITDRKTKSDLGSFSFKLNEFRKVQGLDLNLQPFNLNGSGAEASVLMAMKLRVFIVFSFFFGNFFLDF